MKNNMISENKNGSPNGKMDENVMKSLDYLKELRVKREKEETDGLAPKRATESQRIEKLLQDKSLNDYERMELVKRHAEIMEKKAKREEFLIQHGG